MKDERNGLVNCYLAEIVHLKILVDTGTRVSAEVLVGRLQQDHVCLIPILHVFGVEKADLWLLVTISRWSWFWMCAHRAMVNAHWTWFPCWLFDLAMRKHNDVANPTPLLKADAIKVPEEMNGVHTCKFQDQICGPLKHSQKTHFWLDSVVKRCHFNGRTAVKTLKDFCHLAMQSFKCTWMLHVELFSPHAAIR